MLLIARAQEPDVLLRQPLLHYVNRLFQGQPLARQIGSLMMRRSAVTVCQGSPTSVLFEKVCSTQIRAFRCCDEVLS